MDRIERFVISVLVANHSGVLSRVSGMFTRRGFNIDTLTVGETESPEFSRITISTHCDRSICNQIVKQLEKDVRCQDREGHETGSDRHP